ncbi:peptidyl-dipeptidase Dcp [Rhizocola hellebori]|uniref:Peptidyl-dipeptidase Dcp n=1 Tax=Rhizocola hellebori TaxID=1392758 RepID=A0A8J3VKB9_9ACTN|nr:M3 family metallopeptidase [Rhizocola hellebori]GIH09580.1 peptidyl-dipeptidase Dcp [Rhizocola hellebori]
MTANPLLTPSTLPYHLPPFALLRDEHYLPAYEQGMAEQLAEVTAIAEQADAPTFANTIEAMERSGQLLERAKLVFTIMTSTNSNEALRAIEAQVAPLYAAHRDAILLNSKLFARIKALYDAIDEVEGAEEQRLVERYYLDLVRAGAALPQADQTRLAELNRELAEASTTFNQNLLAAMNDALVVVDTAQELDGLSEGEIAAAAQTAAERGHPGKYAISLILPTSQPVLATLTNRELRRRVHEASMGRAAEENAEIAAQMAVLRLERARLLGFASHADYVIADLTAGNADTVMEMLGRITPAAVANAAQEETALQTLAGGVQLAAWDWPFYAEQVRRAEYNVDSATMRPYFELERVLVDGIFFAAHKLYGITVVPRPDLVGYLPEVRVFEVFNEDGSPLGLFLADYHTRAGKRGGAWMNELVSQSRLFGTKPVVVNNMNIVKPPEGEPALLTFDEVNTMFHEFGHALHGLFSSVRYPRFAGTKVPRDFVEFPSQVNEMWATWPEVFTNYAKHYQTGEPMPIELVERFRAASGFNEGFRSTEYLAATLLDLAWHQITEPPADPAAFEAKALQEAGVSIAAIPPRYRTNYFAHIWASDYSAAYYSYIWSEVLDADTVEWFTENGGLRRENGDIFRRELLSVGGSVESLAAFRAVRGRGPSIEPLLARRDLN